MIGRMESRKRVTSDTLDIESFCSEKVSRFCDMLQDPARQLLRRYNEQRNESLKTAKIVYLLKSRFRGRAVFSVCSLKIDHHAEHLAVRHFLLALSHTEWGMLRLHYYGLDTTSCKVTIFCTLMLPSL